MAPSVDRAAAPLAGLLRLAQASVPVLRWLAVLAGRGMRALGRGARALGRVAVARRRMLMALGHRLMWWAALGMLLLGGPAVLGHGELPERGQLLAPFAVGLVLCAALRLLAPARHLRVAALGLGALHGLALVLVWTAFGG